MLLTRQILAARAVRVRRPTAWRPGLGSGAVVCERVAVGLRITAWPRTGCRCTGRLGTGGSAVRIDGGAPVAVSPCLSARVVAVGGDGPVWLRRHRMKVRRLHRLRQERLALKRLGPERLGLERLCLEDLCLERLGRHGLVPDLLRRLSLVPDLTRRLGVMPDLARQRTIELRTIKRRTIERRASERRGTGRLDANRLDANRLDADRLDAQWFDTHRLGPLRTWLAVAVRDHWRDRTPDAERAQPLLGLDVTRVAGQVVTELIEIRVLTAIADRAVVPRLARSWPPPAFAPPGHS